MVIDERQYQRRGVTYTVRSAQHRDAALLSPLRLEIDGETEYLDRERGEAFMSEADFAALIVTDSAAPGNLFLVAEVEGQLVGFSRCQGSCLRRLSHKVEFGVCVRKTFWGYGIGRALLAQSIDWAQANQIEKMTLSVLETNQKAIDVYQLAGFEVEGRLKNDKKLADGRYYATLIMSRCCTPADD
ncbi:GNAT family N-acetyltransferase [Dickeya lacustris]|uniref:GNAT family N-acetyltransferase n=1 Tax=Dickeya lacustris TaxID=2259638 RepID=A0ABY8G8Z9_9GAMM|nr:GNAT family N-acetyltransferase [Dickeya lacustris]WFN56417.1 GNAT family N-acetyltransferase [Dickeya lacustris]